MQMPLRESVFVNEHCQVLLWRRELFKMLFKQHCLQLSWVLGTQEVVPQMCLRETGLEPIGVLPSGGTYK